MVEDIKDAEFEEVEPATTEEESTPDVSREQENIEEPTLEPLEEE